MQTWQVIMLFVMAFPFIYLCMKQVVEEFMALYYWGLRASTCEINQQIAS